MKWMECIKIQTSRLDVGTKLLDFVDECKKCHGLLAAKVYNHATVSDCSFYLFWNTETAKLQGSSIGIQLCNTLKKYGLVDHSVWLEHDNNEE